MGNEQHWDHCIITFMGVNWFIAQVKPDRIIGVRYNENYDLVKANIDTSEVDWNGYCNEAVQMLQKRTPAKMN